MLNNQQLITKMTNLFSSLLQFDCQLITEQQQKLFCLNKLILSQLLFQQQQINATQKLNNYEVKFLCSKKKRQLKK